MISLDVYLFITKLISPFKCLSPNIDRSTSVSLSDYPGLIYWGQHMGTEYSSKQSKVKQTQPRQSHSCSHTQSMDVGNYLDQKWSPCSTRDIILCMLRNVTLFLCLLPPLFFKINSFKNFFQERNKSVKRFRSRSEPTFRVQTVA